MKPKEKAKELIDRFSNVKRPMLKGCNLSVNMHPEHVKQCALIAVDEFIEALSFNSSPTAEGLTEFYEKVKQEINNI